MLDESAVDHINDVVDCEGSLSDVGGEHTFSCVFGCGVKNLSLHIGGQTSINRQNNQLSNLTSQSLHATIELLLHLLYLILTCEKTQDISCLLGEVDLQDCYH